ncbi:MAG: hypothetical protein A2X49_04135 [Lentisphaerae bacterium GWF2_52_8]|nr:MAG: hypothetical protein A2X49_04135 [Lentisphaerae bacterium GWF2_52_8]
MRIALHAMTMNRDAPMMLILSRLLERIGCEVMIMSVRNYGLVLRNWRPHAVFFGTLSKAHYIREQCPDAKLFYCAGEGGESKEFMDENFFLENEDIFDEIVKIFVWGRKTVDFLAEKCRERGLTGLEKKILDATKVLVNSHPRFDLLRFMPALSQQKKTIGINTNFVRLNTFDGRSTLWHLMQNQVNFSWVSKELREAETSFEALDFITKETPYNVSIRPYPLEDRHMYVRRSQNGYEEFPRKHFNGRVMIDDGLDYSTWISSQRMVISKVSSSLSEAYFKGIPALFVEKLSGTYEFYRQRSEIERLLVETAYTPESLGEMKEALRNPEQIPMKVENLEELWRDYYGLAEPGSALLRIARTIVDELKKGHHNRLPRMPKTAIKAYDSVVFWYLRRKDPCNVNFSFKEGYHKVPEHYEKIVDNIMADRPSIVWTGKGLPKATATEPVVTEKQK